MLTFLFLVFLIAAILLFITFALDVSAGTGIVLMVILVAWVTDRVVRPEPLPPLQEIQVKLEKKPEPGVRKISPRVTHTRSVPSPAVLSSAMSPGHQFIQGIDDAVTVSCERLHELPQPVRGDRSHLEGVQDHRSFLDDKRRIEARMAHLIEV